MVPVGARLIDLGEGQVHDQADKRGTYGEVELERRARRYVALCDANRTIHVIRAVLKHAVKVHAGRLIAEL